MARLVHLWILLLRLFLRVTVCNVSSLSHCETNEFLSENLCCQMCSSGSYLHKPCQVNHGKSECIPCEPNSFMRHDNARSSCFSCSQCRDDQEEVAKCTQKTDSVCQCKQGTYCDSENCAEKCHPCSSCPNGRVIRQCNATMDTLCHTFDAESGMLGCQCPSLYSPLNIVVVTAAVITIVTTVINTIRWFCKKEKVKKMKFDRGRPPEKSPMEMDGPDDSAFQNTSVEVSQALYPEQIQGDWL